MADFLEVEPGVWSVIDGNRSYEVRMSRGGDASAAYDLRVNGRPVSVAIEDPRAWNPQAARSVESGSAQIQAPMPGKVVRLMVRAGQEVKAGEGVVVVEAMKMQNELKSPRAGRVAAVHVRENDTVNAGAALITIAPPFSPSAGPTLE